MFTDRKKVTIDNKGFTLVELIVVLAILGILLSLAVPRLIGYTDEARVTADEQLAALYGNTFDILLASGRLVNRSSGDVTISVGKDGAVGNPSDPDALILTGGAADIELKTGALIETNIRDEFISKSRASGDAQTFKSKKYSGGLEITITAENDVEIEAVEAS